MRAHLFSLLLGLPSLMTLASGEVETHRVVQGDSLWRIAQKERVTVEELKEWNSLANDVIRVGAVLQVSPNQADVVPEDGVIPEAEEPVAKTAPANDQETLRLQVLLDRAGFGPGKVDGLDGRFTRQALEYCRRWNPEALQSKVKTTRREKVPHGMAAFINRELPGTGKRPDFKALTTEKQVLAYYSVGEFLAERFHSSEALLRKLNPGLDLEALVPGDELNVPNVTAFEIEHYLTPKGGGIYSRLVGKGKKGRSIRISMNDLFLTLWEGERMLRAFPVTLNLEETPKGNRVAEVIVPGPSYARRKTALDLKAGPNSPVGVVWFRLGNGYGIHGTNDPDTIGRAVSSGCIRLANWDVVRLAGMVRPGVGVVIVSPEFPPLVSR